MRLLLRAVVVSLLITACNAGGSASTERATAPLEPSVRDSAGVTIYEYPADALERAPLITIDSVPMAVIGGPELANDVTRLFHVAFLSAGAFAGYDLGAHQIRVFDSSGVETFRVGRDGEGPGEFRMVSALTRIVGDTLVVTDAATARVTVVDPAGDIVRMEQHLLRHDGNEYAIAGMLRDGSWFVKPVSFIVAGTGAPDVGGGGHRVPLGRLQPGREGAPFDTIAAVYRPPTVVFPSKFRGRTSSGSAFAYFDMPEVAVAWQGGAAVPAHDKWSVDVWHPDGALHASYRQSRARRPTTSLMRDSLVAMWVERATSSGPDAPETPEDAEFNARNLPIADSLPHFSAAYVAPGGTLWLRDARVDWEPTVGYTALAPDGRLLGRLVVAMASQIQAFGNDRLAFRTEDELGIATITVHRLRMP